MTEVAEGWEWVRIQDEPCPQCGYDPARMPVGALGPAILEVAERWRAFLEGADVAGLRRSPAAGVWTPLQYALHVRDMLKVSGERIELACREDGPVVAWFDPGEAARLAYNETEPEWAAAAIGDAAAGLCSVLERRRDDEWARTARRDGVDCFSVAGLACFAVHEAYHHLLDADGGLGAAARKS